MRAKGVRGRSVYNTNAGMWIVRREAVERFGALMLDFLTHGQGAGRAAHDAIVGAIEEVLRSGPRTPDLGGTASTTAVGEALAARIAQS